MFVKSLFPIPLWLCAVLFLLSGLPARAVLTVELAAADSTNPTRFLLEAESLSADPAADREAVNAALAVQLYNPNNFFSDQIEIEATFQWLNQSTGLPVDLQSGGTTLTATQTFSLAAKVRQIVQVNGPLQPAAQIDPTIDHRVAASVRYRAPGGVWSAPVNYQAPLRKWVHFTNTTADDASLNVKALTGTLTADQRVILPSAPGQQAFSASLGMTLHRYDIESAPQAAASVPVKFHLRFYNTSSPLVDVPLVNSGITVTREMFARTAGSPPDPVTDAWTQTLTFSPAAGVTLDPTADYALDVTVSTEEPDTTSVPALPEMVSSSSQRFLVLSGKLWFGGVETNFSALSNDPTATMTPDGLGTFTGQLAVSNACGTAVAAPGRTYGDGSVLGVRYDPLTGDATVTNGTQRLETGATDITTLGGLRVVRGVIRMDFSGALLESGGVIFPAGFGVSTNQNSRRHQAGLDLIQEPLNSDLTLAFTTKSFTPPAGEYYYAFCDRLPIRFRTAALVWNLSAGTFEFAQTATADPADPAGPVLARKFQEDALAALAPLLADSDAAIRQANDAYLQNISDQSPITVGIGTQGQALLSVQFDLGPGQMRTHFPQDVTVTWSSGRFTVQQNEIAGPNYIETSAPLAVSYKRDCDGNCGSNSGPGQMDFTPTNDKLFITADGGLHADGGITPDRLRWGTTELSGGGSPPEGGFPYAHQTSQWDAGSFHAPGFWLAGSSTTAVSAEQRAESLLMSGVLSDGSYERPLTEGYRAGLADYAGLNLRAGAPNAKTGRSVLAGMSTPDYGLKARSKYYIRSGGVTGIHEAAAFPSNLYLYSFNVQFDGFRLAFRDGLNVESKTGGSIHVDSPVQPNPGFDLDFKELAFKCRGQPDKMRLATEGQTKTLAYWGTDFTPLSMEFANPVAGAGCVSVDDGFLMVGAQTRFPSVTPQKLHATLGFTANGNLVTKANPLSAGLDIDSRFTLPPNIQILGAGGVPWEVTVTGRAYLNNPLPIPAGAPGYSQPENGFLTFPATINVPWFEDMKVQFQVSASSTATAASTFYVMGGWPANPAEGNGSGWQIAGKNYFTDKFFDPDNLGFPAGVSLTDYRDPATTQNNPRAQKRWLGVVDFDFPLEWDGVQRRFSSATQTADLVVLGSVQRQVRSLTPSTAEITFGAKLDIPNVNTQSLTAAVKEGISGAVADALTDALGGPLKEQLGNGISRLDGLLCERIDDLLLPPLEAAADPLVDAVLAGDSAISQLNALRSNLATLPDLGLLTEVDNRLQQGISGIDAALSLVGEAGNRQFLGNLVRGLLERSDIPAVAGLAGSAVDAAFASVLPEIEPDLEQAREVLLRARGSLVSARTRLTSLVPAAFQETAASIDAAAAQAVADIDAFTGRNEWQLLDPTSKRAKVRRMIAERVLACAVAPKIQFVVRQTVQDTSQIFRAGLDDILGQVNQLMRSVIEEQLGDSVLPQTENPATGGMAARDGGSAKLAGINIEGYAQINDESLRVLDINGKFEFNIPDAMLVQAHLRIEEYDANTPAAGCRGAGTAAAVVQIDARAQCDWINTEATIVEVGAKFSLQDGAPVGFDGYFAIDGEITLGPVVVNEARFLAGFGGFSGPGATHWGYVGAKIRGRFEAYEAAVGVFFGRTCDVSVIRMIDPQVGKALTDSQVGGGGPVTGVYFYGEAWIPVNEVFGIPSTCLFTVRAGAGAGFFAFVSDSNQAFVGCKQFFGVEGRLLCIFGISGKMSVLGAVTTGGAPPTGASADNGLYKQANNPAPPPGASFILRGDGEFAAELGICPFCVELSKSIGLTWTIGGANAGMDIEL